MPRPSTQPLRAGEVYARTITPDWQDDPALRRVLESIYAEWGLNTKLLKGQRTFRRKAKTNSLSPD